MFSQAFVSFFFIILNTEPVKSSMSSGQITANVINALVRGLYHHEKEALLPLTHDYNS